MRRRRHWIGPALTGWALVLVHVAPVWAEAELRVDRSPSRDGVYRLSWTAPGPVVIEASPSADFARTEIVYRGRDTASTLSGRRDGETWYRVVDGVSGRLLAGPLRVEVRHHPLSRALAFFGVGLVVFAATTVVVVRGARAAPAAVSDDGRDAETRRG